MALHDARLYPWLIEIAIEPKSEADRDKLNVVLASSGDERSEFGVAPDPESGQLVLKGMSEQYLAEVVSQLKHTHNIGVNVGPPQVVYRETISRAATVEYVYKKQAGGSGQFAGVKISAEPLPSGRGFVFENEIVDGVIPPEYIPGVEEGLESGLGSGVLAGFPVIDLKIRLIDGKYHDVDSSVLAFEIAARTALREALQQGAPILLQPIMTAEVTMPADIAATVMRDLALRGRIHQETRRGDDAVVRATAALANMLGYANALHSLSRGRAAASIRFDHYAPAPPFDGGPPFRPAIGMRA
jgi:elongation factor G